MQRRGANQVIRNLNIRQVRNELEKARQQLPGTTGLRDEAQVEQAADTIDQIQAAEAREFALRNLDRYARQLRQIERALQRLDTGDYGVCVDCEQEIAAKRLRAVPWTPRCLKCQELFDERELDDEGSHAQILMNAA
jgi:DnaK suppressor protein